MELEISKHYSSYYSFHPIAAKLYADIDVLRQNTAYYFPWQYGKLKRNMLLFMSDSLNSVCGHSVLFVKIFKRLLRSQFSS